MNLIHKVIFLFPYQCLLIAYVYSQWPVQTKKSFSSHVRSAFGCLVVKIFSLCTRWKRSILLDREKWDCKNFFVPTPQGLESIYGWLELCNYKTLKRIKWKETWIKFQLSSSLSSSKGNSSKESFCQQIYFWNESWKTSKLYFLC